MEGSQQRLPLLFKAAFVLFSNFNMEFYSTDLKYIEKLSLFALKCPDFLEIQSTSSRRTFLDYFVKI